MGGILEAIANALGIVKEWLGFQSKRLDLKNAQDMKAAAERQDEQAAHDRTEKAIANHDLDQLRKDIAE